MKPKRRGRTRRIGVERTESGRISRAREPKEDTRMVALSARIAHHGLSKADAVDPHAGTVLGRLWLRRAITAAMRQAGERYLELRTDMLRAIKAPDGYAKGTQPGVGGDLVSDDYIDWAIGAVARYKVACAWLDDISVRSVVDAVVIEDRDILEAGLPYLCLGLNVLAKRLGIEAEIAA